MVPVLSSFSAHCQPGISYGKPCVYEKERERERHARQLVNRLEALQDSLDCHGLLAEDDKHQFGAHSTQRVDSGPEGNHGAFQFWTMLVSPAASSGDTYSRSPSPGTATCSRGSTSCSCSCCTVCTTGSCPEGPPPGTFRPLCAPGIRASASRPCCAACPHCDAPSWRSRLRDSGVWCRGRGRRRRHRTPRPCPFRLQLRGPCSE